MKISKFIFLSTLLSIILLPRAQATSVFPASDNQPLNQNAQPADSNSDNSLQKNMPSEKTQINQTTRPVLEQIDIQILFGTNLGGEKGYRASYRLKNVSANSDANLDEEPHVVVTYKNKADKDQFAVAEVMIKKSANSSYQISAKVVSSKPDKEKILPKITYLD